MEISTADAAHEPPEASTDANGVDTFDCAICWDLLYKPIVLPCGHVFCFWCIQKSMGYYGQSRCPLCSQHYTHFPAICKLLDLLVFHATPHDQFKQRESEIHDMEVQEETFAPAIERPSLDGKDAMMSDEPKEKSSCNFSPEDFLCVSCKEFLYRPVVLNCGEAFCEICIRKHGGSINSCPSCNAPQPALPFKCCLVFQKYLEHLFPDVSKKREAEILAVLAASEYPSNECSASDDVPLEVHYRAGCDGCGMCPIFGERYKCKDCPEKIGFDLCKVCYERGGIQGGRFNQQHKPSHNMERVPQSREILILSSIVFVERNVEHEEEDDPESEISENEDEPASELVSETSS